MSHQRFLTACVGWATLAALGACCGDLYANDEDKVLDQYEKRQFKNADGETLNYRWYFPSGLDADDSVSLLIFLHGAGERGADNEKTLVHGARDFLSEKAQRDHPCAVLIPQCPDDEQWVDAPWTADAHDLSAQPSDALRLVGELLDQVIETKPIDQDRVYLTGLSMGGFGAWDLLSRHPKRFAAVVPICGGGDAKPRVVKGFASVPIWVFHGADDPVVKVQRSRDMVEALRQAGGKPKYTEYPTSGHNSWTATYANPELFRWLFNQKRTTKD